MVDLVQRKPLKVSSPGTCGWTVTRPCSSTTVCPDGSAEEGCRNQAGEPFSAGPSRGGTVAAHAPVAVRISAVASSRMHSPAFFLLRVSLGGNRRALQGRNEGCLGL